VVEAGPEVSFGEMQRVQSQVVEAIRKDPAVTGVVSLAGVSTTNPTSNAGRLSITLKSRDDRSEFVTEIVERLERAVAPIAGVTVFFQPAQDIQISTRPSRALYQYTLTGTEAKDVTEWSERLAAHMRQSPILRDVAVEAQE